MLADVMKTHGFHVLFLSTFRGNWDTGGDGIYTETEMRKCDTTFSSENMYIYHVMTMLIKNTLVRDEGLVDANHIYV